VRILAQVLQSLGLDEPVDFRRRIVCWISHLDHWNRVSSWITRGLNGARQMDKFFSWMTKRYFWKIFTLISLGYCKIFYTHVHDICWSFSINESATEQILSDSSG
jgi:hypothetical protein